MKVAIFTSGYGFNAKKLIERFIYLRDNGGSPYEPVVVFSDNPNSNAEKIATQDYKSQGIVLPFEHNSIIEFCEENGEGLKDEKVRAIYDRVQRDMLKKYNVNAVALAGYDWIVSSAIYDEFLTINVHPGDLRVKNEDGDRAYTGLGWVPIAKAILKGEKNVRASTHLVRSPLIDRGSLLAISAPQEVLEIKDRALLLGGAGSLKDIQKFIRENQLIGDEELALRFPIYRIATGCQKELKVHGDGVVFPYTLENIARGYFEKDKGGKLYFNGGAIPNGIVCRE